MINIEEEKKKLAALKEKAKQRDEKEDIPTPSEPYTPPQKPEPVPGRYPQQEHTATNTDGSRVSPGPVDDADPVKDIYQVLISLLRVLDRYDVFRVIISVIILSGISEAVRVLFQKFLSGFNAFMSFMLWSIAAIIIAIVYGLLLKFVVKRSYKTVQSELKIQSVLFCTYLTCSVLSFIYASSENLTYINLGVIFAAFYELYK